MCVCVCVCVCVYACICECVATQKRLSTTRAPCSRSVWVEKNFRLIYEPASRDTRASTPAFFSYTYIYIYKFARDNNTDMPDRDSRFNLFTVPHGLYHFLSLSLSHTLALSLSLPLFRVQFVRTMTHIKLH